MIIKTKELRTFLNSEFEKDFKNWNTTMIQFALQYDLSESLRDSLHAAYNSITSKVIVIAEKNLNSRLKSLNLEVAIIETSEYYEEELSFKESDEFWNLPMYEAYIANSKEDSVSETTGRYCDIGSVLEELSSFVDTAIEENI